MSEPARFEADAWLAEFDAPPRPAVKPIELAAAGVEVFHDRESFAEALRGLSRQACVVIALRAAKRVNVLVRFKEGARGIHRGRI